MIEVTIISDRRVVCDAACGVDWSSPEAATLARKQIAARFGERVRFTFYDLSEQGTTREVAEWKEAIKARNLSAPLLLLDGQLRIAGGFDYRQMMDAIEAESEISGR